MVAVHIVVYVVCSYLASTGGGWLWDSAQREDCLTLLGCTLIAAVIVGSHEGRAEDPA